MIPSAITLVPANPVITASVLPISAPAALILVLILMTKTLVLSDVNQPTIPAPPNAKPVTKIIAATVPSPLIKVTAVKVISTTVPPNVKQPTPTTVITAKPWTTADSAVKSISTTVQPNVKKLMKTTAGTILPNPLPLLAPTAAPRVRLILIVLHVVPAAAKSPAIQAIFSVPMN